MVKELNISSKSTSILSRTIKRYRFRGRARLLSLLSRFQLSGKNKLQINQNIIPLDLRYSGDIGMFLHEGLPHENGLLKILLQILEENDVFYDIGANIGYYTAVVSGFGIPVISFEPNKSLSNRFEWLLKNRQNVNLFTFGLSDKKDTLVFNVSNNNHGLANFRPSEQNDRKQTLKVYALAEVIKEHTLSPPTIIKIDVEGFEYKVLRGLTNEYLEKYKPIVFMEFANDFAKECGFTFNELKAFCDKIGYQILRIENNGHLRSTDIEKPISGNDLLLVHKESSRVDLVNSLIKN